MPYRFTIKETAEILGLKVRTIREWIKTGKLKAYKGADNAWHIPAEQIFTKEVQERADKSREHSRRIKEGIEMGLLSEIRQNS